MSPRHFIATLFVLLLAAHADAGQARIETEESTPSDQGERAVPRAQPRSEPAARPAPQPQPRNEPVRAQPRNESARARPSGGASAPQPSTGARAVPSSVEAQEQERAVPRGSRPQGDNPRTGTAVPRGTARPPVTAGGGSSGGGGTSGPTIIVRRPPVYNYYYPQRYYPYGYGGFGLGYFYYDPYTWYPGGYYGSPRYDFGRYPGRSFSTFDTGELRLRVTPRHAQVFIDGYYAGVVDDYDGTFQALRLEEGPYRIEIVAPGFRPLEFDVRIIRGRKISYRGDLERP